MNIRKISIIIFFVIAFLNIKGQRQPYLDYLKLDLSKGGVQSDISDLVPYTNMKIGGVAVTVDMLPLKNIVIKSIV